MPSSVAVFNWDSGIIFLLTTVQDYNEQFSSDVLKEIRLTGYLSNVIMHACILITIYQRNRKAIIEPLCSEGLHLVNPHAIMFVQFIP